MRWGEMLYMGFGGASEGDDGPAGKRDDITGATAPAILARPSLHGYFFEIIWMDGVSTDQAEEARCTGAAY